MILRLFNKSWYKNNTLSERNSFLMWSPQHFTLELLVCCDQSIVGDELRCHVRLFVHTPASERSVRLSEVIRCQKVTFCYEQAESLEVTFPYWKNEFTLPKWLRCQRWTTQQSWSQGSRRHEIAANQAVERQTDAWFVNKYIYNPTNLRNRDGSQNRTY